MKGHNLRRALRELSQRLSRRPRARGGGAPDQIDSLGKPERKRWRPQLAAYRLIGERTNRFLPLFKDLDTNLHKAGIRVTFKPYVSLTLLMSLALAAATLCAVPLILHFALQVPAFPSLLFGVGGCLFAGVLTIVGFYGYPTYRADGLRRGLDDTMAFSASYLAILAQAGVPPEKMFRSLSKIPQKLAVVDECKNIVRDVDLFGADIITALGNSSKRSPSEGFKDLLEGLIATVRSGGNLASYLRHVSKHSIRLKRIALREFSDTLGVLSEFYVTLLVAGPLIFVVMLSVMSILGGDGLGMFSPNLLLALLTYIAIPVGSIIFVIILDALSPR